MGGRSCPTIESSRTAASMSCSKSVFLHGSGTRPSSLSVSPPPVGSDAPSVDEPVTSPESVAISTCTMGFVAAMRFSLEVSLVEAVRLLLSLLGTAL